MIYTRGSTAIDAVTEFTAGFDELNKSVITPQQDAALQSYYTEVFVKGLQTNTGVLSQAAGFVPTSPAARYLQANYTAPFTDFGKSIRVDDAGDGSAWSAAHAKYHDYFRELVERFHYGDALLLDTEGTIVYSAFAGADLGTSIQTGPFRDSNLAGAYRDAMASNSVDFQVLTDFGGYQPSYAVPTAWAVSPIGANGVIAGALALELPITAITM